MDEDEGEDEGETGRFVEDDRRHRQSGSVGDLRIHAGTSLTVVLMETRAARRFRNDRHQALWFF